MRGQNKNPIFLVLIFLVILASAASEFGKSQRYVSTAHDTDYVGPFLGSGFLLLSVLVVPIMRRIPDLPQKNLKTVSLILALTGLVILLAWYAQR